MAFIEVTDISKKYGRKQVLTDINFTAEKGDCIGIVGANGCGKSTLLKILQGGHKPNGGTITYDGNNPLANHRFFQKYIGYVPQDNPLFANLTVMDNLKLWYCDSRRDLRQDIESGIIKDFKIDSFIKSKVANLSGGMKKRLSIACALATNPQILIMDEPGASLDIIAKNDIVTYMKKYIAGGGTIIISSHEECELSVCTKMYLMKDGVLESLNGSCSLSSIMERMVK